MRVRRLLLPLSLGLLLLASAVLGLFFIARPTDSPWKTGQTLRVLPPGAALYLCRVHHGEEKLPFCLRGYYQARLKGPVVGDPARPCRGLSGPLARACSEVQGLRLVEHRVSAPLKVCASMPDPLACARHAGRKAFDEGGFKNGYQNAENLCSQEKGDLSEACYAGAAIGAVERSALVGIRKLRERILQEAEAFCLPRGGEACWASIASTLKAALPKEEALEACAALSLQGAVYCVEAVKR